MLVVVGTSYTKTWHALPTIPPLATRGRYILHEHVYPIIRTWGVVIGGSATRPAKPNECPATLESLLGVGPDDGADGDDKGWPWQKAFAIAEDVKEGFGHLKNASAAAAAFVLAPFEGVMDEEDMLPTLDE